MRQNIKKLIAGIVLVSITGIFACNKDLNVTDQNNPTTESYFKTAAQLQNGVNAIYSTLRAAELVGREWFFTHDMRGGECAAGVPSWKPQGQSCLPSLHHHHPMPL